MTGTPLNTPGRRTIAIIAALPRELALLAKQLSATPVHSREGILLATTSSPGQPKILLATAGMGAARVSLAVAAALAHGHVDLLLSVGLAGACDPSLAAGDVLEASLVIDSQSGERFTPAALSGIADPAILVTTPRIASPSEKQRLHATYNAAAVDMEAATVARLARAHNIPFAALKTISDGHTVDLTHLSRFSNPRGHFRTSAFALHTALRPHIWQPTAALGRNTSRALHALTSAIHQLIAQAEAAS